MEESLIMDRIRTLFTMLDRTIYGLISVFYNTISDLASVQLLSTTTISEITSRVYTLLGIFMLFKVSFSVINYIIDPEKIADKAKGGGHLIRNIVITFVLIVTVPFGFNLLYEAQSAILSDQIIPTLVFGTEASLTDTDTIYKVYMDGCEEYAAETNNMGDYIGLAIFKPFFIKETENFKSLDSDLEHYYCTAGGTNNDASVDKLLLKSDLYNAPKGWSTTHNYNFNYSFIISSAIGIFVGLIFLGFCFDIASRTLKLLFLEIIAPVPIISFIDPDSSKNTMFKKWIKDVFNTWLSLFIRLISVFLAIYIIQQVSSEDGKLYFLDGYNFGGNMIWLKLLIIIGILIFAKQLPKIVEDLIGLKAGEIILNPFKKADKETGGFIGGVSGVAAAGVGAVDAIRNGNGFRDIADGISKGYAGGKKNPIRGLFSGMTYSNQAHTDNAKARKAMRDSDELINKGKNLFNQTKKMNSDGSFAEKEDGTFDRDESKIFKNDKYRQSFEQVDAAKKLVKEASRDEQLSFANYQAEINKHGNHTDEAKNLEKEWNAASARSKGATGNLEYIKERHSNLQKMSMYKNDAENENALEAYKKTHSEAMRPESSSQSNNNSSESLANNEDNTFEVPFADQGIFTQYKKENGQDNKPTNVNGVPYGDGKPK